jgi:signal transduction histidine kinase
MKRLVKAVQELSLARDFAAIAAVVRTAARELTGADGATLVLRDGDHCFYADENAIAPLWKGQRFPMSACISGWVMLHGKPAEIENVYTDPRIPHDAYRPTFVRSLVMVPIRASSPIGAIGNYWSTSHVATSEEVELLQALANTTSVAMENAQLYTELEQRVHQRTEQLEALNQELEAFSFSVSHDLQAPLRIIAIYAGILSETKDRLDAEQARHLEKIVSQSHRMSGLIESLLRLARLTRSEPRRQPVHLSALAREIAARLQAAAPERRVRFQIEEGLETEGDEGLLGVVLENLLSNALKYTSKRPEALIEFGADGTAGQDRAYFVRDNGVGLDMASAQKLFTPFTRFHRTEDFPGNGIGLATVQRIIRQHGGEVWAEARVDLGACFHFRLPGKRTLEPGTGAPPEKSQGAETQGTRGPS